MSSISITCTYLLAIRKPTPLLKWSRLTWNRVRLISIAQICLDSMLGRVKDYWWLQFPPFQDWLTFFSKHHRQMPLCMAILLDNLYWSDVPPIFWCFRRLLTQSSSMRSTALEVMTLSEASFSPSQHWRLKHFPRYSQLFSTASSGWSWSSWIMASTTTYSKTSSRYGYTSSLSKIRESTKTLQGSTNSSLDNLHWELSLPQTVLTTNNLDGTLEML